jgi:hypothetical protein
MLIRNSAALSYGANKIMIKPAAGGRARQAPKNPAAAGIARARKTRIRHFLLRARGATFSFRIRARPLIQFAFFALRAAMNRSTHAKCIGGDTFNYRTWHSRELWEVNGIDRHLAQKRNMREEIAKRFYLRACTSSSICLFLTTAGDASAKILLF